MVPKLHLSLVEKKKKIMAGAFEANRWRQAGRTKAAESDDITAIEREALREEVFVTSGGY